MMPMLKLNNCDSYFCFGQRLQTGWIIVANPVV